MRTVPFVIEQRAYPLDLDVAYLVLDKGRKRWSDFTQQQYLDCISNPGYVCTSDHSWSVISESTCIGSLVHDNFIATATKLCPIKSINMHQEDTVYDIPLSRSQWLISVLKNVTMLYLQCRSSTGITADSTTAISGISIVQLDSGCQAEVDGHVFEPTSDWMYTSYESITLPYDSEIMFNTSNVRIVRELVHRNLERNYTMKLVSFSQYKTTK